MRRRAFLQSAAMGLASTQWALAQAPAEPDRKNPVVVGKDRRLILVGNWPVVLETPLNLLAEHRLTPREYLFVRNNQHLAGTYTTEPLADPNWSVEITGLASKSATVTLTQLQKLDAVERELVLQCSGNGRKGFNRAAMTKGTQWGNGGMGNVTFAGPMLATVLRSVGIDPLPAAKYLTAEGKDAPDKAGEDDFEHSITVDDAMTHAMIAVTMNGQPIPAIHGGPVRLVIPGFYATMNVKWLNRLRLEAEESRASSQMPRYRNPIMPIKPGDKFDYSFANSEPNWRMKVKSCFLTPVDTIPAGKATVSGIAFNDGQARIASVEVTTDAGKTWRQATLEPTASRFAWTRWSILLDLPAGAHTLLCRAVDEWGRGQPADAATFWNEPGYLYNAYDQLHLKAVAS